MTISLLLAVVGSMICSYLAGRKGRNRLLWSVAGFFLGVFAVIAVAVVRPLPQHSGGATRI